MFEHLVRKACMHAGMQMRAPTRSNTHPRMHMRVRAARCGGAASSLPGAASQSREAQHPCRCVCVCSHAQRHVCRRVFVHITHVFAHETYLQPRFASQTYCDYLINNNILLIYCYSLFAISFCLTDLCTGALFCPCRAVYISARAQTYAKTFFFVNACGAAGAAAVAALLIVAWSFRPVHMCIRMCMHTSICMRKCVPVHTCMHMRTTC